MEKATAYAYRWEWECPNCGCDNETEVPLGAEQCDECGEYFEIEKGE